MMYADRPKIKLTLTPTDKLLEILGWGILVAMWILVVFIYSNLPPTIPIHFNASGAADRYGSKSMIWGLLLVGSAMYIGMTYLTKYPYIFNYPNKITEENALRQYTIAAELVRCIKLLLVIMISFLIIKTVYSPF